MTADELSRFKAGIYLHYKGYVYEADHLTHNASEDDRIEIHYIGLQLQQAHTGPRHATRQFKEFLFDRVHPDGSTCAHDNPDSDAPGQCSGGQPSAQRFRYLGPAYDNWMSSADPFQIES